MWHDTQFQNLRCHSVWPNKPGCFRHSQKWKESKREQKNECFPVCNVCPLEPADRLTVKNIHSDTEAIGLDIRSKGTQELRKHKVRLGTYSCCQRNFHFLFLHFCFRMGMCITFIFHRGDQEFCNTAHGVNCNTINSIRHMLYKDEIIRKYDNHYNIFKALDWWNYSVKCWRRVSQSHNSRAEENWQYEIVSSSFKDKQQDNGRWPVCLISLIWFFTKDRHYFLEVRLTRACAS